MIRRLVAEDAFAFVSLLAEVAREDRWIATEWPFDTGQREREIGTALRNDLIIGWGVFDGDELAGELSLHDPETAEPTIGMLVTAQRRGQGVGRALIDAAIAWAEANGKDALALWVYPDNDPALALYRRSGFREVALARGLVRRRDGTTRDAMRMRRPVPLPPSPADVGDAARGE